MAAVVRFPTPMPQLDDQAPRLRVIEGGRSGGAVGPARRARRGVYLWRRMLVLGTLVGVVVACLGVAGVRVPSFDAGSGAASGDVARSALALALEPDGTYRVRAGETMWSVAGRLTDGDPRPVVDRLVELNGGASVHPGERLQLP